jgi:hypothetical protein
MKKRKMKEKRGDPFWAESSGVRVKARMFKGEKTKTKNSWTNETITALLTPCNSTSIPNFFFIPIFAFPFRIDGRDHV